MRVKVGPRVYDMPADKYRGLLKIASKQVPFGVYAVEKKGYAELKCDQCNSTGKLKELTRAYKSQGFRVYANRGIRVVGHEDR